MTVEEYLNQVRKIEIQLKTRERMIAMIRANLLGSGIDYSTDRVQSSPNLDTMAKVEKLVDLKSEILQENIHLLEKRREIVERIERIKEPKYVELLTLRYVYCMAHHKIAKEMNYIPEYIRRLHSEALSAFRDANTDIIE